MSEASKLSERELTEKTERLMDENKKKWETAWHLGITKDGMDERHPDVKEATASFANKTLSAIKKSAIVTGLSGIVAAAIPAALHKKLPRNNWLKALIILASGGTGTAVGGYTSLKVFSKPLATSLNDLHAKENAALDQEIAQAIHTPAIESAKSQIQPRDPSFAAQTVRESEQTAAAAVTVKY